MSQLVNGLESISIGAPGANGAPGTSLTRVSPIADGSVQLNEATPTFNDFRAEDIDGVILSVPGDTDAPEFVFGLNNLDGATRALLMGGTYDTATKTYSETDPVYTASKTVVMVTAPVNGVKLEYTFPLCNIVARENGAIGRANLSSITVTCKVLVPLDGSGVAKPYKLVKYITVT